MTRKTGAPIPIPRQHHNLRSFTAVHNCSTCLQAKIYDRAILSDFLGSHMVPHDEIPVAHFDNNAIELDMTVSGLTVGYTFDL
jgi:hypothetical protein